MFKRSGRGNKAVELVSPLSHEACYSRITATIDRPWTIMGDRSLIGYVSRTGLRVRKRIVYRNPFQVLLVAKFIEADGSTRIHCRFSMQPFVIVFTAVWFGGVLLIGGSLFLMSLVGLILTYQSMPAGTWSALLIPPLMLLFGLGLTRFGQYLARDERQFLLAFLCKTLMARLVEQAP